MPKYCSSIHCKVAYIRIDRDNLDNLIGLFVENDHRRILIKQTNKSVIHLI